MTVGERHKEKEAHPLSYWVDGHAKRAETPTYINARKAMRTIVDTLDGWYYGKDQIEDHHGGGLWVHDGQGWFFVRNLVGIEWSGQFCADPAKVDVLRKNAKRLYARFPESFAAFKALGIDLETLLDRPITDDAGVDHWTDSICNASVPLPRAAHTGVLPKGAGVHHYPTPIIEIEFFKRDDFELFVKDEEGNDTAVVPTHYRGSGKSDLKVVHAAPGSKLERLQQQAHARGDTLVLDESHPLHAPLAKQAFAKQVDKGAPDAKAKRTRRASSHTSA
jgi:hypothetical protein